MPDMILSTLSLCQWYCVELNPYKITECDKDTPFEGKTPAAKVFFDDTVFNTTGWMNLSTFGNPNIPQTQQYRAVGYAEGYLQQHHIFNHKSNVKEWFLFRYLDYPDYPTELLLFFRDNLNFIKQQVAVHRYDNYWKEISKTMQHFFGMVDGYQQVSPDDEFLSELDLYIYVSSGDLLDIVNFALPQLRPNMSDPKVRDWRRLIDNHCTGYVRFVEGVSYMAQTAWFFYGTMTRVKKEYTYNNETVVFSSYPGFSYSFDDWYSNSRGFMFIETTNSVFDTRLYELCSERSVMTWIRSQVAGRLARRAQEWAALMRRFNSGTYNNQWIVIDSKKMAENPKFGGAFVVEQIPGRSAVEDITEILNTRGWFPSFNIPSLEGVRLASGYFGSDNILDDYYNNPRMKIFEDNSEKVVDENGMKWIMRYNDLKDPAQLDNPGYGISSRYDLRPGNEVAFGGFDAKIGKANGKDPVQWWMISGPVKGEGDQYPAWDFDKSDLYCPRRGLKGGDFVYDWISGTV